MTYLIMTIKEHTFPYHYTASSILLDLALPVLMYTWLFSQFFYFPSNFASKTLAKIATSIYV